MQSCVGVCRSVVALPSDEQQLNSKGKEKGEGKEMSASCVHQNLSMTEAVALHVLALPTVFHSLSLSSSFSFNCLFHLVDASLLIGPALFYSIPLAPRSTNPSDSSFLSFLHFQDILLLSCFTTAHHMGDWFDLN